MGSKRPPDHSRTRKRGALLGLAVGDALGTTTHKRRLIAPPFPELAKGPQLDMVGKGPFNLKPGQTTDETQMAYCLGEVLRRLGRYDLKEVAKAYCNWQPVAFDIDAQLPPVLKAIAGSEFALETAAKQEWFASNQRACSSGSLKRTAPIGIFLTADTQARIAASLADSALTHFDPRCQLACVAFNAALACAITHPGTPTPDELAEAARVELALAATTVGKSMAPFVFQVQQAYEALRADLELAKSADPMLYGPELHMHHFASHVRVGFRFAFWELFHAPSLEAALIDVVNRGGDADTNASLTGALLGAVHGESAIPARWKNEVLGVLEWERGPLGVRYHAKHLLALVS